MKGLWSDKEKEIVKTMWNDGSSATQISRALPGRSRNAVLGQIFRGNLPARQKRPCVPRPALAQPKPEKQEPEPTPEDPGPSEPPIDTLTLHDRHCKWPYDNGTGADYLYCGRSPATGHPFCPYHCKKAYQPQQTKKFAA